MINFIFGIILAFWFIATAKQVLFWIYLWQLKEYHIPRFLDHFRTAKGKKLITSPLVISKVALLIVLRFLAVISWLAVVLYAFETAYFVYGIIRGRTKKPVFTLKAILLTCVSLVLAALYGWWQKNNPPALLVFNIIAPFFASIVVLVIQPLFVGARNRILEKARLKMQQFPNLLVIGVTGSYGKTSTKEFITEVLAKKFKVLETPDHKNSEMGIAQTILKDLHAGHEIFVVEMGSYAKGGIKLLCDMVKPKIGVVTGVNEQHLALFGSLENLLSAEGGKELLEALPKSGTLIVNGDNQHCLHLYKQAAINKKVYTVNRHGVAADLWAEEVQPAKDHVSFVVMARQAASANSFGEPKKEMAHVKAHVLGQQHVQNLLAAMCVGRELGMSLEEVAKAVSHVHPKQAGMTVTKGVHGLSIIDASYSSNPDGAEADLDYLKLYAGKRAVVMPCLIELGQKSANIHFKIGKKLASVANMVIVTTQDFFEDLQQGAIAGGMKPENIVFSENPKEILAMIGTFCSSGDTVLLEGRVPSEVIKLLTRS